MIPALIIFLVIIIVLLSQSLVIIPSGHSGIKERLGRRVCELPPGLHLVIPYIERVIRSQTSRKNLEITVKEMRVIVEFSIENFGKVRENVADLDSAIKYAVEHRLLKHLPEHSSKVSAVDLHKVQTELKSDMVDLFMVWGVKIEDVKVVTT